MREEGKVAGDRAPMRRRSPRLIRKEELRTCASEQDLILKLKEEERALWALQKKRLLREGHHPVDTEAQPAGNTKRKKVLKIRVPLERIEYMILNRHRRNPYQDICDDLQVGKRSQRFREIYAERMAIANKYFEYQDALIKQFRTKGYADDYAEVTDDDDSS
ncbi:unnamed protein product [Urochloa humidicola]